MKIKTDFVTNSSSTSFLLALDGEFTKEGFFELMGIKNDSPLDALFTKLFNLLVREMRLVNEIDFNRIIEESPSNVAQKLLHAKDLGKNIFQGELSTEDGDTIESLFCVESFEAENDDIYFNYLECIW